MSTNESYVPPETMRDYLLLSLEGSARWRRSKAAEHPEYGRNALFAAALDLSASEVASLPDDDARLATLERLRAGGDDDAMSAYVVEEEHIISRHGFDSPEASTDDLLDSLAKAAERVMTESRERTLEEHLEDAPRAWSLGRDGHVMWATDAAPCAAQHMRDFVAAGLEALADLNLTMAAFFPDHGTAQSAATFRRAAREMAALPDSDARLIELGRLYAASDQEAVELFAQAWQRIIPVVGFDPPDVTTNEVLDALAEAAEKALAASRKRTSAGDPEDASGAAHG